MSVLRIRTAEAFAPLLEPSRYKGAHGGRGSGKSHFFAELAVEDALRWPGETGVGIRFACIREVQKSLKESAKRLIEDKLQKFGLGEAQGFKVYREVIETPKGGLITFTGMQDHTADSVKSMEGFHRAWVEEAATLSDRSLMLLRPTIRAERSELWFSWNPNRPTDPVDQMLRGPNKPQDAIVIQANWNDNPWLPAELDLERREAERTDPDRYGHIWNGEYARVYAGAYFASHLEAAEREGRVDVVTADPLLGLRCYWDIGGTGSRADSTAIWVVQFVADQVRVLDYYEAQGQEFAAHVHWLQKYKGAVQVLPHDGRNHDKVNRVTPQSFLRDAGFDVQVMPNMGGGAAIRRIEAVRRLFPAIRFNRATTEGGRDALAWYHAKRDEVRGIDLGPEHDWASHGADAFGAMAVDFYQRNQAQTTRPKLRRAMKGIA